MRRTLLLPVSRRAGIGAITVSYSVKIPFAASCRWTSFWLSMQLVRRWCVVEVRGLLRGLVRDLFVAFHGRFGVFRFDSGFLSRSLFLSGKY